MQHAPAHEMPLRAHAPPPPGRAGRAPRAATPPRIRRPPARAAPAECRRWERLGALALAVGADLALGEPPNPIHPVAWLGRLAALALARAPRQGAPRQLAFGGALTLALVGLAAGLGALLARAAGRVPGGRLLVEAALLKSALSLRMLADEAQGVERWLCRGDLAGARHALRALVSRDPSQLGPELVAAAVIESVAENASDAVVAPLLYWVVLGPAGALAYRAANTLDAMIGYRGACEYLGKPAARLDDLLNLAPSRLTALLLGLAAAPLGLDGRRAWRTAWREHARTASPNAGWPMAAMAGALGRRLEKVDAYTLGDGPPPAPAEIARARRLYALTAALALALAALAVARPPICPRGAARGG